MVQLWGLINQSRFGIYKVLSSQGNKVILEEIFTKKQYLCYAPNNPPINPGELWLVRLMPKAHQSLDSFLVFTSPYVLMTPENLWLEFLDCNIRGVRGTQSCEHHYEVFMKNGLTELYWLEFIFQAYGNHTDLVIYLYGVPDLAASRLHVSDNGRLPERKRRTH